MIQAKTVNPGIKAAIEEMKVMGLIKNWRALHEAHMKQIRDRKAEDAYVYDQGVEAGRAEGHAAGEAKGHAEGHAKGHAEGHALAESKMQTLIAKMAEAGEADKLPLLADKAFLQEMYRKYQV